MKIKSLLILALFIIASCTNKKGATRAIIDAGYHPIEVGGYGWWDCSKGDKIQTRFKAYSADSSRIVTGCVCEGWFKGKTIRLD